MLKYPQRMVKDFRNFIVHEYFGVDTQIVWDLTRQELDELVGHIKKIEGSKQMTEYYFYHLTPNALMPPIRHEKKEYSGSFDRWRQDDYVILY